MDYREFFKDKKVTLMGLGLLGRGVGDARFLSECGARVLITDTKSEEELKESVSRLKDVPNLTFKLGGHDVADFKDCDMVLKAAGVPLDSPYINEARNNNIPVYMGAALFCKLATNVTVVGITGTRGKSTTTHLIHHILKSAGKSVLLGGNVRDVATLPLLKDVKDSDVAVLELDSWQLQGFADAEISPQISVFTTFLDDHMNYYGGDREKYFKDKSSIYRYQKREDTLIAGEDVAQVIASKDGHKGNLVVARRVDVPRDWDIKILGEHNLLNISCAIATATTLNIPMDVIKQAVESFVGVEGRLQFIKEVRGIKIYNDNNATTPDATVAGLKSVDAANTILIAGGADKGLDLTLMISEAKKCKKVILIPGSGTDKLKSGLDEALEVASIKEAVESAFKEASIGDTILFSPGFASFGPPPGGFRNEYDRNDQFLKLIGDYD